MRSHPSQYLCSAEPSYCRRLSEFHDPLSHGYLSVCYVNRPWKISGTLGTPGTLGIRVLGDIDRLHPGVECVSGENFALPNTMPGVPSNKACERCKKRHLKVRSIGNLTTVN